MEKIEAGKNLSLDQLDLMRRERLALSKLTTKQKLFCEEYVSSFNKLQALKAGGFWTPKHKGGAQDKLIQSKYEDVMASEVVQEYIYLLKQSVASRLGVSMDQIVDAYKIMAFANIDDYVEWNQNGITKFKDSKKLTKAQKAGILEITETTTLKGSTIKIKLHPKQPALDRLFEILKELEEHETKPKSPAATISQAQINIFLADPIKRRAVEHVAETLFGRQIALVGTNKEKLEFDQHLTKITTRLLEATSGIGGTRTDRKAQLPAPGEGSGESEDGNVDGEGADASDAVPACSHMREGETAETSPDKEEIEDGSRYDIDELRPVP
ncbi:MAG: terminase small subunit [Clostridiaceae bacterium]